jgi:hypothetical protein
VVQTYWVESEELWSANDHGVTWHGRLDGAPVVAAVPLPRTEDAIVLLDSFAGPRNPYGDLLGWPHLLRVRPTGSVVWRATAGDKDWWVAVIATEQGLFANTWSCYRQMLDADTGKILSSEFTK